MKKKIFVFICIILFSAFFAFNLHKTETKEKNDKLPVKEDFIPNYVFSNTYKTFNFKNKTNKKAIEIFKKFLPFENSFSPKDNNQLYAFSYDLDSDKEDEIIGAYNPFLNNEEGSYIFHILKKQNDKYINIFSFSFSIEKPISILKSKTNGFYDIGFIGSSFWKYKPFIINFNGIEYKINEKDRILYKNAHHDFKVLKKVKFGKNKMAQNALFSYAINEYKENIENFFDIFKKEEIMTFLFDLDNDGENEIIGSLGKMYFCGAKDIDIFILKKTGDKYKNLTGTVPLCVSFAYPIEILEEKTNGYHKFLYYSLGEGLPRSSAPYIPFIVEYYKGLYQNEYAI